jgi:hypothetical protein
MSENPLKSYFRQPKIYINLPSKLKYYPAGTIEVTDTGEFPVYPMTATDEIAMKTPDALLNGQATIDVIQSCIPNIKNAWYMPNLDLDAVLIAIRIATYGDKMDIETVVPKIGEERSFSVDLRQILDNLLGNEFEEIIEIDNLIVHIRPMTYQEFTKNALKTFEEQRLFTLVNNEDIPEEEKLERFNNSFRKLTELTVGMVSDSITKIQAGDDSVTDPDHIQEFLRNADKKFYTEIVKHIEEQKEKFSIKPLTVETYPEDREKGAPDSYEVPIVFDQSNFFV